MIVNFDNKPLPVHAAFHRSTARERMLFGAYGSGKTYAIMDEVHAWCLEHPGIRGLVTRKTAPALRDTTEKVFQERMPAGLWDAGELHRAGGHFESFVYPNGSVVLFRSMDDPVKHRSLNLGFIAWDEANEFAEEDWLAMESRVRQVDLTAEARARGYTGRVARRGMWGATNPNGKDWLWRRFHPDSPDWKAKWGKHGCVCFTSTTLDNPFLPPDYVESLLTYPKPYVQRYVLCQFDDFKGRIYEEWGWDTHVVPHPQWATWDQADLAQRTFWMSMDPGTSSPTAALWVWLNKDTRQLVGVAEYEEANLAADVHAKAWRRIEAQQRMQVQWRVGDPNAITQRDRGTLIGLDTQYQKLGFHFNLGGSHEPSRIASLGRLIHLNRFVLTPNCPKTFEAIKEYQWKDLTPAQIQRGETPDQSPLKKNTHLVECAQYLAGREAPPPKIPRAVRERTFSQEIHQSIRNQQRRNRSGIGNHDLGGCAL